MHLQTLNLSLDDFQQDMEALKDCGLEGAEV